MAFPGFGEIAERLRRSTVEVASGRLGRGSGIVLTADGTIVTNAHVAVGADLAVRLWDGSSFPAKLESRSARRDLALLRIPAANLIPAALADSDELRVGEPVIAVGNPLGFTGAVTTGVVHALGRRTGLGSTRWIQADVRLAPGNSGGPLADARGRVVGVNTMVAGGLGLAVPANTVARLLAGDLEPPALGVMLRPAAVRVAGSRLGGLEVLGVEPGSAAEYASLRAGDLLVGIEGRRLRSVDELEQALEEGRSGEKVLRLQFVRADPGKIRTAAVLLGASRPTAA
jgi:serine protease Do